MIDRVLVTGADGFIGRHLIGALKATGITVLEHSLNDGDIARARLEFEGVAHVFHLAGKTFVPESWKTPEAFYEVNVMGTVRVLEYCRHQRASITLVSSYVYGQPQRLPIGEDHPLSPANPYSHSKIIAEEIGRYYGEQLGLSITIVRPFNIFGPGQAGHFLIPKILKQVLDPAQDQIKVADLRPRRDYLYVEDLVSLLMATMARPCGSVYNAGSGVSVSVAELIDIINGLVERPKPVCSEEQLRPAEIPDVVADISRATKELQWRPHTDLAQGLRLTIAATRLQLGRTL